MLPYLPTETVQNIIRLSLPPANLVTYRERYNILLAYSLVCRAWRCLAQEELFESVVLVDAKRTKQLGVALRGRANFLASMIRSLRLGGRYTGRSEAGPARGPWEYCPALSDVRVRAVRLQIYRLADFQSLRRLHLHYIDFTDVPLPSLPVGPLFGHLEHLSISFIYGMYPQKDWNQLFSPSHFPTLRSLMISHYSDMEISYIAEGITSTISSLGPQLVSLAIIDISPTHALERLLEPSFACFTALEHLVLLGRLDLADDATSAFGRPDLYPLLPKPLQSLEILLHSTHTQNPLSTLQHLAASLRSNAPGLRGISRVAIPAPTIPSHPWDNAEYTTTEDDNQRLEAARNELASLAMRESFILDETDAHLGAEAWYSAWIDFGEED